MKRWKVADLDDGPVAELARRLSLPLPLARSLATRGLSTPEAADRFLNSRLSDLGDPFSLPGMELAVDRIWKAIREDQPIVVYGDYDVDGVTSAALMSSVLTHLGARVHRCLPSRMEEGYGLGVEAVARCIAAAKPGLIVTTDCGSGAHEAVAAARAAGVDVVVTDHHEIEGTVVDAVAVVNPKLGSDESVRMLAGVGVAFKVCHAVLKKGRSARCKAADLDLRENLDLVALGTISDMVPLRHENRILARHGLVQLNKRTRVGLNALAGKAGVEGEMGTYHIGFVLGPRMNAVGRLGHAEDALELLMTGDADRADVLAAMLDEANRDRKRIENGIMEAATRSVDAVFDPEHHFGIVVGDAGWHVGVVGIVASRLAGKYGRPSVVVAFDEYGMGRGSCRSIEGFDLLSVLKQCGEHLTRYGGHEMAAGLELEREAFGRFQVAFRSACAEALKGRDFSRVLELDAWVTLPDILDPQFLELLERMAPFGEGNPEPVWGCRGVQVLGPPRVVGDKHLKFRVGMGARQCEAIGFNMADRLAGFPEGAVDVAFSVRMNTYLGRSSPQMQVQDFRAAEGEKKTLDHRPKTLDLVV